MVLRFDKIGKVWWDFATLQLINKFINLLQLVDIVTVVQYLLINVYEQ